MRDAKDIHARQGELANIRAREEPAWRDITRIIRPDDQDFNPAEQNNRDNLEVFDSSPMYALADFVGGMFGESMNPADRWFELSSGDDDLDKFGPVKQWMWDQASDLYKTLSPAVSNFYTEATAWLANAGALGNGFQYQEEWEGRRSIIDQAVPVGQCYIDTDVAGNLDTFHRRAQMTGRKMKQKFGDLAKDARDDVNYTVLHAVYPNDDYRPGRLGTKGMAFASTYLCEDLKDFRRDKGYYEMPYHGIFWNKRAGTPWATGPGHNARPDMNTNNEMERSNLVAAQFDAEPMIMTHDDAVVSAADISPNAVLSGTMSDQGKKLIEYLERRSNPQHAEAKTKQRRDAVREAFLYSVLQILRERPQMTATETLTIKEERLRYLGPNLIRVQQGLATLVGRRYAILQRAGQARPAPPELQGRGLAMKFVSPLAKAQEAAIGRGVIQWITSLGQVAQATGRTEILDNIEDDEVATLLHRTMANEPKVLADPRKVAAMRQNRNAQIAQQQGVEQAAALASTYADVAHAKQAESAAGTRKTP